MKYIKKGDTNGIFNKQVLDYKVVLIKKLNHKFSKYVYSIVI